MINIFIDTSGSMSEMGKNSATVYVAKSIEDYCQLHNIDNSLYKFDGSVINSITNIIFDENIDITILNQYITSNKLSSNIVITDGLYDKKMEIGSLVISIGIDADDYYLEKTFQKVFVPENIIGAIEYLSYLDNSMANESEKDEDEW